jgi:hypothetical protein
MEAPSPVPLCSAKQHDVDADPAANLARTVLPRFVPQDLLVNFPAICPTVVHLLVVPKEFQHLRDGPFTPVEPLKRVQASLFESASFRLIDLPCHNPVAHFRVGFHLWYT